MLVIVIPFVYSDYLEQFFSHIISSFSFLWSFFARAGGCSGGDDWGGGSGCT